MSSSSRDVATVLYHLDDACEGAQLEQLKLALECLGIGQGKVNKVKKVHDAYHCLCCEQSTANEAIPLLYAVLEEIAVPVKVLSGLKKWTTTEKLKECCKRKDFSFAKMIIKLCNEFSQEDFEKFCQLCLVYLEHTVNSDHCNTIVKLFQKLIRARKVVYPGSVKVLSGILREMQKESSLEYVQAYNRVIGDLSQETEEGSSEGALPNQQDDRFRTDIFATGQQEGGHQSLDHQSLVVSKPMQPMNRPDASMYLTSTVPRQLSDRVTEAATETDHTSQSQMLGVFITAPKGPSFQVGSSPRGSAQEELVLIGSDITPQQDFDAKHPVNDPGALKVRADGDSISSQDDDLDGGKKKEFESIPLLDNPPTHEVGVRTDSPRKKQVLIGCFAIAVVTVLVAAGSCFMVREGIQMHLKYSTIIDNSTLNMTLFAVEGDTIVLGMVNTGVFSKVTVEETTERGDSSHVSSVFLVRQNDLKKHSMSISKHFSGFYSKVPWRTTGLIDHTYILGGGLINYSFCAAQPSEGTGDGYIYVFNSEKHYSDYSAQDPGSQSFSSAYKKMLHIGSFNQSECRSIQFSIDNPGYYYVVVDTPGDMYYNYSYEIRDIYLDHMDYDPFCKQVYEGQACSFDLPTEEPGLYYILAYVTPHIDLESHTTHLRLMTSGVTTTVQYQLTVSVILLSVGGGVLLLCFAFLTIFVLVCVYIHRNHRC